MVSWALPGPVGAALAGAARPRIAAVSPLASRVANPNFFMLVPYLCWGPGKGWILGCFRVGWPRSGPCRGRWWSARSAARTNDLEAGEDPPHTGRPWERSKDVVVQVICCLPGESVMRGDVVARASAQPYLGPL